MQFGTILLLMSGQIILALLFFWLLPISQAAGHNDDDLLPLSIGQFRGLMSQSLPGNPYVSFLGIPYAEAPVGELRFAKPVPKKPFSVVQDATVEAPACLQFSMAEKKVVGQEDCLFLNIYKPVKCCSKKKLCPVMMWIHGGGFTMMDASPTTYGPDLWMNTSEVILVTVQFRLGALGFWTLENDAAPGNLGLRDQSLALHFIHQEAFNFCGDPDRITVFGSGSGSYSTVLQYVSPHNQISSSGSLIKRIIAQSGSAFMDLKLRKARPGHHRSIALALAKMLGCSSDSDEEVLSCMTSRVDGERIHKTGLERFAEGFSLDDWTGEHYFILNPWLPYVDGHLQSGDAFLPQLPEDLVAAESFRGGDVMIGGTAENGLPLMSPFIQHPLMYANFTEMLPRLLLHTKTPSVREAQLIKLLKLRYIPGGSINRLTVKHAIHMMTDMAYNGPIGATVQALSSDAPDGKGRQVYHYYYRYSATNSFGDLSVYPGWKMWLKKTLHSYGLGYNMRNPHGISHGDELMLFFHLGRMPMPFGRGPITARDRATMEKLLFMWTHFAKSGNPTPLLKGGKTSKIDFVWHKSTPSDRRLAVMTSEMKMAPNPLYWIQAEFYQRLVHLLSDHPDHQSRKLTEEEIHVLFSGLGPQEATDPNLEKKEL